MRGVDRENGGSTEKLRLSTKIPHLHVSLQHLIPVHSQSHSQAVRFFSTDITYLCEVEQEVWKEGMR